jgi:hypothetical protein
MTQESLLKNQVLEELLREKSNNYQVNKQQKDFWILNSPNFINKLNLSEKIKNSNFYKNNKNKNNHFSCLISLDKKYIQWIELRLGYFENIKDLNDLQLKKFVSDGIIGSIDLDINQNLFILEENKLKIDPNLLSKEFEYITNKI